jgi:hypothetical protein
MNILETLQKGFDSGNSWLLIVLIFVISTIVLVYLGWKRDMIADWGYESVIEIPEKYQKLKIVQDWFTITRGFNYDCRKKENQPLMDHFNGPTATSKTRTDCLISGFAFLHVMQHFCIAFFCPKLIPYSFAYGVAWEMVEVLTHMHCTLDILWNTIGCLFGLLCRSILCPVTPFDS